MINFLSIRLCESTILPPYTRTFPDPVLLQIHVDDLARNFELNRQSGLMIAPFYLRPDAAQQDAMRQSAAYFAKEDEESSTPSDSAPICDAANDRELYLLALYLTHVAPQSDFTKLDHAHWRREGIKLAAHISRTTAAAGRKMQA